MTDLSRRAAALVLCLVLALGSLAPPAAGADLPRHRGAAHHAARRAIPAPAGGAVVVVPAVPLAPAVIAPSPLVLMPVLPDPVLAPRRGGCRPGFVVDADGTCRRTGELLVACDAYGGGPCRALPPTPIPYGIGPYLRREY